VEFYHQARSCFIELYHFAWLRPSFDNNLPVEYDASNRALGLLENALQQERERTQNDVRTLLVALGSICLVVLYPFICMAEAEEIKNRIK
jgi:hypothetical protein